MTFRSNGTLLRPLTRNLTLSLVLIVLKVELKFEPLIPRDSEELFTQRKTISGSTRVFALRSEMFALSISHN